MKSKIYSLYAFFFNIFSILPLKKNKIVFLSPHNENFNDSLGAVMEELIRRDEFRIISISSYSLGLKMGSIISILKSIKNMFIFFTVQAYHLATAKYIFLNDNFMPMGKLKFNSEAEIIQLWHAEGVFKKFGLDIEQPEEVRKLELQGNNKLSYVICSSESVVPYYADAFGIDSSKVLPLGAARTDYFYKKINDEKLRAEFDKKYPECKNKKLVLYAPTFRDDPADDKALLDSFDIAAFNERFGDTHQLLIRLHPQVHTSTVSMTGVVNVGDYDNVSELIRICDVLITDYSSICMDFALLEKPIYFYAFDFDKYNNDRSFYFDYEGYVPGPVTTDFPTLLNLMNSSISETYIKRRDTFNRFNFDRPDGRAAERIVNKIVYKE